MIVSPVATDSNGNPKATGSAQSLGKDDFLNLMITKLKYQDPMKPMDDEDFIAQLAQFSTLEQMNNIAEGIASSNQWDFLQMQSINNSMATGLIGKDIIANYEGFLVDGEKIPVINFTAKEFAKEITFTIKDEQGNVVANLKSSDVLPGVNQIEWDSKDNFGNTVDNGYYKIEVKATGSNGNPFKPSLSLIGTVESIAYRDGGAYLRVNGTEIALGDVTSVGKQGIFSSDDNTEISE